MNNFFVRLGLGQKRPAAGVAASIVLLFSLHFCAFAANPNACDIVSWGSMQMLDKPATAISSGGLHTMALKNDSTVVVWGDYGYGET